MPPSEQEIRESQVAQTILAQLGGKRFMAMTGAHSFTRDGQALIFKVPRANNAIRGVKITLTAMDDYTMEFFAMKGTLEGGDRRCETVAKHEGIYFDQLEEIFRQETGLATRLNLKVQR